MFMFNKNNWHEPIYKEDVKQVITNGLIAAILGGILGGALDYLFNVLNYDFLLCGHYDKNHQSQRVQEKCGFIPYRKLVFDTSSGNKEPGVLMLLKNPNKNIEFVYSHPETLLI